MEEEKIIADILRDATMQEKTFEEIAHEIYLALKMPALHTTLENLYETIQLAIDTYCVRE